MTHFVRNALAVAVAGALLPGVAHALGRLAHALGGVAQPLTPLAQGYGLAAQEPEAEDVLLEKVDLRGIALVEACRLLSDQTGWNVVPSAGAAETTVSLYLRDVGPLQTFETLCAAHQLWFQADEAARIVRIHTVDEYKRDLVALQEETTEYFTLLYPNALSVGHAIEDLFGDRVSLRTDPRESEILDDLTDRFARFDVFDRHAQSIGLGLGVQGGGAYGYGGIGSEVGFGALSGTNRYDQEDRSHAQDAYEVTGAGERTGYGPGSRDMSAEEILEIERLLAQSDEGDEARSTLLDALTRRYRSPIHVAVAQRQNQVVVRTGDLQALDQIRELVRKLDVPTALVLLEVRVLAISMLEGESSFFEYEWTDGKYAGEFATGAIQNATPPALGVAGTGVRAGDLVFQFVDDTVAARLQALEIEDRLETLSTPVLLTANNEVSRLFVGREVPLNRSFSGGQIITNENSNQTTSGSTAIEFRPVGTTLLITPNINADRTVTLRIVQEKSDVDSTATVLVPDEEGFTPQVVNVVSSQTVSGTIVAKSDHAVVFGGLIEERVQKTVEQVPYLGDIPLLGVLFQRRLEQESQTEIVVVVKPYVLSTPAESEGASYRMLSALGADVERLGLRGDAAATAPEGASTGGVPNLRIHGIERNDP